MRRLVPAWWVSWGRVVVPGHTREEPQCGHRLEAGPSSGCSRNHMALGPEAAGVEQQVCGEVA